eukprot:CAMPEP_0185033608 /NCGR_PEP_ID=MMETSP1103-20130426/22702_1 /TAXON_ID=36769 /ORGANISM="Paraphysomonas bandaiensis, Strain Caron Lab Isolate" /LENGTH=233 /DNA_ID=CAMNT_0027569943 /DNA_START=61 /DNA_END=762 /DNA_ORIENTATION=+
MAKSIVVLDLSYNRLHAIPPEIGELQLLRELRASFNIITHVPSEIGKLKRLRKLILNGNRIASLPPEVGRLEMLEELVVSENCLEEIPHTIATMAMLRVLKLQNNLLRLIPYELVDVVTLEELDFSGNANLKMVPKLWQGDTDSVLFVCKIHRDYQWQMQEISSSNNDLVKHSQYLEQEQLLMKEQIAKLKNEIELLRRSMPASSLKKFEQNAKIAAELGEDHEVKGSKCTIM